MISMNARDAVRWLAEHGVVDWDGVAKEAIKRCNDDQVESIVTSNPEGQYRTCTKCKKTKGVTAFSSRDSVCRRCRNVYESAKKKTRECITCGVIRPRHRFVDGSAVCLDCERVGIRPESRARVIAKSIAEASAMEPAR